MAEKQPKDLSKPESQHPSQQPPSQQQRGLAPFQDMERMERMFEDFLRRPFSFLSPGQWLRRFPELEEVSPVSLDIFEEGDSVVVKAEVPGIRKEDLEISFVDNSTITISGEKRKEEKVDSRDYYRMERSYGRFSRSIRLPAEVEPEGASASFRDGILDIHLPKSERARQKNRKIPIG